MAEPAEKKAVRSFEELRIFQEARELVRETYSVIRSGPLARDHALADQMRRSAISVLSNIAEGFERETDAEFIRSLYIAKGSCGELRAQLLVAADLKCLSAQTHDELASRCRKISAGLSNLIAYLKRGRNSEKSSRRREGNTRHD